MTEPTNPLNRVSSGLTDPRDHIEAPIFIGEILGKSDRNMIKFRTLSTLGPAVLIWVDSDDITDVSEYEDGIVKITVREGADIFQEEIKRLNVGSSLDQPKLINAPDESSYKTRAAGGSFQWETKCGKCDWVIATHCTSCRTSSSRTCLRPFLPYGAY